MWIVQSLQQLMYTFEIPVYNIQMMHLLAAEEQRKPDMPIRLFPRSKDCDIVYVCSFLKEHCAGQRGAERRHFYCVYQGAWGARAIEEGEAAFRYWA